MGDPAIKTSIGLCVLLAGACAAMLFRHDPIPPPAPDAAVLDAELLLRCRAEAPKPNPAGRRSTRRANYGLQPATVVTPIEAHEPPPALAAEYPHSDRAVRPRFGASMEATLASTADDAPGSHTIVDGDTLAGLAARYLGAADRAREIFELNRDVLSDFDLLPIGKELRIPPRRKPAASGAEGSPLRPLTPVR